MEYSKSILNDEQQKAVQYTEGPLLIVAGAGTGKTLTLVEKIKHIIATKLAKPNEILALTFTEKAAHEMEERVDRALPYGYIQTYISTFHSFADQILKEHGAHIGLNPGYKLLTDAETILFIKNNLFLFNLRYFRPLGNPTKFLEAFLQHFSRLRDEDISPEEYTTWAHNLKNNNTYSLEEQEKFLELADAYKTYQEIKIKKGYFDFSDLIFYLLALLRSRPSVLSHYHTTFKYILVDEFQDTNIAQYQLIKLLCPPESNPHLTVVGDDSQAIYKFRGASVSNILAFMKDYPSATEVTLTKNYRSNQAILDAAYRLIRFNNPDTLESKLGISKELIAHKKTKGQSVFFQLSETLIEEADSIASKIQELVQKEKRQYSDFALLVRANSHGDAFMSAFARRGIPYHFLGPGMLFKQPEVKDLISYLKILYNPEDSPSFYRVLSMSLFQIDSKDIHLLLAFAKKTNLSLFQASEICASFFHTTWLKPEYEVYESYLPLINTHTKERLLPIISLVRKHLSLAKKETAGQILYSFLEKTGYLTQLVSYKSEKEEQSLHNITKFFGKLKTYETEHEDASIFAVVDYIDMSMELGESPIAAKTDLSEYNAVSILTAHSSKGLEFPVVFLVNLNQGRFPTYEKKETVPIPQELIKEVLPEGDYHLQEERRLFYVAATRAMDKLFLSASQFYGEGKRERKVSTFVSEAIGEDEVKKFLNLKTEEKIQLSIFDFKKQEEPIVKEMLDLKNFSFSQLESFSTCPLQYKYQYVLKIPTLAGAAASFGDTIHKTLQKFYEEFSQTPSIGLERLLELYRETWVPVGYSSKSHQEKMKKEGNNMLTKYFELFHKPDISVLDLEKLFKIKIENSIFVTGKIDRVDNKSNGEIEIIDYKTGKKPEEKKLKKSLQLSIYALAASHPSLYNRPIAKISLTFYYLQDMEKVTMKKEEGEMIQVKQDIVETVTQIRHSSFTPKVGPWCNFCAFRIICEAWQ